LCQKEAHEVRNLARNQPFNKQIGMSKIISESGLEGVLIKLLDIESDEIIIHEIYDILNSMLNASLNQYNMKQWINLCKETANASFGKFRDF
jgi:hypothetical protein